MASPPREKDSVHEAPTHLLVDGHNVLHAWRWVGLGDMTVVRNRLVESLRILHDVDGVEVTAVFDGRGPDTRLDPAIAGQGIAVVHASSGLTADGEIERRVAQAATPPERTIVVTADATIRGNVLAAGGECLSPAELRAWIERCERRVRRASQVRQEASQSGFGNKLPL